MGLYLWLDLLIIAFPLSLSFDRKVRYVRRWPAALASAVLVGVPYLAWDSVMSMQGAWGFTDRFAGAFRFLSLPAGELAFFLAVPFACIFINEVVRAYVPERVVRLGRLPWVAVAALCAAAAFALRARLYTSTVLAAAALFFGIAAALAPDVLSRRRFWVSILVSYVPFLLANGVLTALPVVTYSDEAILGFRVLAIPIEDFLYSFTLLGFNLLAYRAIRGPEPSASAIGPRDAPSLPGDRAHDAVQHPPVAARLGLVLLLLGVGPANAASPPGSSPDLPAFLSQLRIRFYRSVDSAAVTEETLASIERAFPSPEDSWPPVIRAYDAALEGLRGKHAGRLLDKAGHVRKAVSLLRGLPEANPSSLEILFLRFSLFHQLPLFFGVRSTVAPDLAALIRMLEAGSHDDVPREIQRRMAAFLLECGEADRQQADRLRRLSRLLAAGQSP